MSGVSGNYTSTWMVNQLTNLVTGLPSEIQSVLRETLDVWQVGEQVSFNMDQLGLYECIIAPGSAATPLQSLGQSFAELPAKLEWRYSPDYIVPTWLDEHVGRDVLRTVWDVVYDVISRELRSNFHEDFCFPYIEPNVAEHAASKSLWIYFPDGGVHVVIRRKCDPAAVLSTNAAYAWFETNRMIWGLPPANEDLTVRVEDELVIIESGNVVHNTGVKWKQFEYLYG